MVFGYGIKNIQATAYNGARMVCTKILSGMSAELLEDENSKTLKSKSGCYGNGIRSATQQLIVVMNVAVA